MRNLIGLKTNLGGIFLTAMALAILAGNCQAVEGKAKKKVAPTPPRSELDLQRLELARCIAERGKWNQERLAKEVWRKASLILPEDKTPADIVLRRTSALLNHLKFSSPAIDLAAEEKSLETLKTERPKVTDDDALARFHDRCAELRRQIALKNPLLNFDKVIFLKHQQLPTRSHMVDQYLGFNQVKGGGVFVLEEVFGKAPKVRSILAGNPVQRGRLKGQTLENNGSFIGLDLDFDGKSIVFAFTEAVSGPVAANASFAGQPWLRHEMGGYKHYYWDKDRTFHIFRAGSDGTGLVQLTDGMWNEYDPCFLPGGRIAFLSEKDSGQARCSDRGLPCPVLFSMRGDGSDIIRLSWHETNEWQPSVDNHGMIVYTRWDYVDRDSDVAHHLWSCFPDGRDPRSVHGNYPEVRESRPWMEMQIRAIPNSGKYVAVAAPHHGQAYGSLILLDPRERDDKACGQVRRLTPEINFPESEMYPGVSLDRGTLKVMDAVYACPWPLSEDFFLCVYDSGKKNYGLYLVDSFGNRELLYRDPAISCLDPMPLQPRTRPPVIPPATNQAVEDRAPGSAVPAEGEVLVMNVYESDREWPANTQIVALRVVNLFPKNNFRDTIPIIGVGAQSMARGVLGTVPVENDGSAYFKMPAGCGFYLQALDKDGLAVQTMRSDMYLHPGERLGCAGCHEPKHSSRPGNTSSMRLAIKRPPSTLTPEPTGAYPLSFPRLVQPVVDAKCLSCHEKSKVKAPSLRGDKFVARTGHSEAYFSLTRGHGTPKSLAWAMCGGNGTVMSHKELQYSLPGQIGARASRLYQILKSDHHGLKLTPEEMHRFTLWLDCNSVFFGAYEETEKQARGEVVRPKLGVPEWTEFSRLVR